MNQINKIKMRFKQLEKPNRIKKKPENKNCQRKGDKQIDKKKKRETNEYNEEQI